MKDIRYRFYDTVDSVMKYTEGVFNRVPYGVEDLTEPMMFTGLFDKYGVEIYEGDIVRCKLRTDKEYWLAEVKWSIDAWCLGLHTISSYVDIEVIGNIYENPELLN